MNHISTINKDRSSNFELLRIFAMIFIIAHHYVVNSGFTKECFDFSNITFNMIFLQFVGFGGKMAINIFILISAYFMCKQKATWIKFMKFVLMIYFYNIIFTSIFWISGYESISLVGLYETILWPFRAIERGFVGGFLVLFLLIPFLNKTLDVLNHKLHLRLIVLLLFIFTIASTFLFASSFSYIGWYVTLYYIGAYIKLYPNKFTESKSIALKGFLGSLLLIFLSILVVDFIGSKIGFNSYYWMCADSNKFLALTCGLSMFLLFKNTKIKHNKAINTFAASTFGVLLIHANSDAMRRWLWNDILKNIEFYNSLWLPLHFFISITLVYLICVGIDYLRILFIENPLFIRLKKISFLNKECFIED
ncbi:MAG: acyltransferase [Bacteroidia bacterium]|nr:acyltransferase [Bacteroidia bacterium]